MKFLTPKNIALLVFALSVIVIFASQYSLRNICPPNVIGDFCGDFFYILRSLGNILAYLLVPVLLMLPFSLTVFESWKKFALWAVPIMLVLTGLLVLGGEGSSYFSFGFGPFILTLLYGAYFLASLIIIVLAILKERKKN
jgi:hypothetical protein